MDSDCCLAEDTFGGRTSKRKRSRTSLKPIGFGGLGVFYVAFAGQGVTHLTSLGLTQTQISLTLLSGPICGAVLQPYFGSWSDRYRSPWGRRKPFIVIGALCLIISMLCLAWSRSIVGVFMTRDTSKEFQRTVLAIVSILSVWAMYASVQAVQVGMRVLVTDGCTVREQADVNSWAGRYISVGGVVGNLASFLDGRYVRRSEGRTVLTDLTLFATICLIWSLTISCICVGAESSAVGKSSEARRRRKQRKSSGLRQNLRLLKETSSQFRTICLVQFLSWLGWFPFYFYAVTYVNSFADAQVSYKKFSEHNKPPALGSLAFLTYSTISLITSILLPYLATGLKSFEPTWMSKRGDIHTIFTMRHIWMTSHAVFGFCMLGTFFVQSSQGALILFTLVGFSWAVTNWIPYALLGAEISAGHVRSGYQEVDSEEGDQSVKTHEGFIYGLHGLSICLPQIMMALFMGMVSMFTGSKSGSHSTMEIVWTFRIGGVFAFIAMFCTLWIRDIEDYGDSSDSIDDSEEHLLADR